VIHTIPTQNVNVKHQVSYRRKKTFKCPPKIAYAPDIVELFTNAVVGLTLNQIIYWLEPAKDGTPKSNVTFRGEHRIAKSCVEIAEEIGKKPHQVRHAIDLLRRWGVLIFDVGRFWGAPTGHIDVNWDLLGQLLQIFRAARENAQETRPLKPSTICEISQIQGNDKSLKFSTEITTENTFPLTPVNGGLSDSLLQNEKRPDSAIFPLLDQEPQVSSKKDQVEQVEAKAHTIALEIEITPATVASAQVKPLQPLHLLQPHSVQQNSFDSSPQDIVRRRKLGNSLRQAGLNPRARGENKRAVNARQKEAVKRYKDARLLAYLSGPKNEESKPVDFIAMVEVEKRRLAEEKREEQRRIAANPPPPPPPPKPNPLTAKLEQFAREKQKGGV
jgi:hypothetical protein